MGFDASRPHEVEPPLLWALHAPLGNGRNGETGATRQNRSGPLRSGTEPRATPVGACWQRTLAAAWRLN